MSTFQKWNDCDVKVDLVIVQYNISAGRGQCFQAQKCVLVGETLFYHLGALMLLSAMV